VVGLLSWGLGVGHVYLGRTRRGIVWFFAPFLWFFAMVWFAQPIGAMIGYRAWMMMAPLGVAAVWALALLDIWRLPRTAADRVRPRRVVGMLALFFFLLFVQLQLFRRFGLEAFRIPSGAMIPTLLVGEHIFVEKTFLSSSGPGRGEVVVHAFPEHPEQDFIKRVIAVPGDRFETRKGHPWINGAEVPSCRVGRYSYEEANSPTARHSGDLFVEFLGGHAYLTLYDDANGGFPEYQGPWTVKQGEFWVMGDNRNNSHDSRMWWGGKGGGVPFEDLRGRALFVWLAKSDDGAIDGSRFGLDVDKPALPPALQYLQPKFEECLRHPLTAKTP
jgi:signal peptidase I